MLSYELSREVSLRQDTCWPFNRKIQEAMKSSGDHTLKGRVDVDEMVIGGHDGKSQRRSNGDKKLVCLAVEIVTNDKMGRAYGSVVDDNSTQEMKEVFDKRISKDEAKVRTDEWGGYDPIGKEYKMERIKANKGKNFPNRHNLSMNFKLWLRGIYHKCGKKHIQAYLDKFFYRFNWRNFGSNRFHNLIVRMV